MKSFWLFLEQWHLLLPLVLYFGVLIWGLRRNSGVKSQKQLLDELNEYFSTQTSTEEVRSNQFVALNYHKARSLAKISDRLAQIETILICLVAVVVIAVLL
jgi:hypothetical protein